MSKKNQKETFHELPASVLTNVVGGTGDGATPRGDGTDPMVLGGTQPGVRTPTK